MHIESRIELCAVAASIDNLSRRWGLQSFEMAELLGSECFSSCAPSLDACGEYSARLLLEIDVYLNRIFEPASVSIWLRDVGPDGLDPLTFMALGVDEQRGMLQATRLRAGQLRGGL